MTPVVVDKFNVPPPPETFIVSMLEILPGVTEPVIAAYKTSVPAPPSSVSCELKVMVVDDREEVNVSLPALHVNLSTPVVSVQLPLQ